MAPWWDMTARGCQTRAPGCAVQMAQCGKEAGAGSGGWTREPRAIPRVRRRAADSALHGSPPKPAPGPPVTATPRGQSAGCPGAPARHPRWRVLQRQGVPTPATAHHCARAIPGQLLARLDPCRGRHLLQDAYGRASSSSTQTWQNCGRAAAVGLGPVYCTTAPPPPESYMHSTMRAGARGPNLQPP